MIKTETIVLDNKVRLVLSSDKSKNQTYAEIIVGYGGMNKKFKVNNEVYNIPEGMAHLLEHAIVENNIYGNMFEFLKDEYVEFNARTSSTRTSFFINTVFDFERHLVELINIVNNPIFDEERLKDIKKPIIEEIKRGKDRTYKRLNEKINYCTLKNTNFKDCLGSIEDITNINAEFMQIVYDTFYQPANQTIFIAGNFDIKKITKLIENTYKELNKTAIEYEILDKKETTKVRKKKAHVVDSEFDEIVNITFKVDISKLTPKEKVKGTFYLGHFLDYNFNDASNIFRNLMENKDTVYSIDRSLSCHIKDMFIIDLSMMGTNRKKFKKLVLDIMKNKYYDEEMFNLWKKETLIDMIVRSSYPFRLGIAMLDNIMTFGYNYNDTIKDIEDFSLEDYINYLDKLEFKDFCIVYQTKK